MTGHRTLMTLPNLSLNPNTHQETYAFLLPGDGDGKNKHGDRARFKASHPPLSAQS